MKYSDIVSFRKDLLFNGAVQLGWLENDKEQAKKAAEYYVFHGPSYHGVAEEEFADSTHKLIDTASFTLDIFERISGKNADEPFALAIAGYGTGKSHLSVTLASLLSAPDSTVAQKILDNITSADANIGRKLSQQLKTSSQPFLVIAVNGMQDFDLSGEIIRQALQVLYRRGIDTSVLENLRPRFKSAQNFVESFFTPLHEDFVKSFGATMNSETIIERLKCQDEDVFRKVSDIFEQKMGSPIYAVGQESLHDFIRVTKETFCGPGKPFAGLLIIFDEFGRYLEFAVQKPHIAGSGTLQQLFESVQANSDGVFLLCFIQYELKAYISRVAPELRDDLNRYVTRYDSVRKVRLSTNLETLIANLLEKKESEELERQFSLIRDSLPNIHQSMIQWFPDIKGHTVWEEKTGFEQVICKGCWPLHPLSTWVLYKLSSVGKALQQRSAFSFLSEVYSDYQAVEVSPGRMINPVELCNDSMINEFLASERYGQQGATAHAYESVILKYQHELSKEEKNILRAVLLSTKVGVKLQSKEDCLQTIAMFSGLDLNIVILKVKLLESEFAVLEWNERLHQYEIAGDSVPKRAFLAYLETKINKITSIERADLFGQNFKKWSQKEVFDTDFGADNLIFTKEWHYTIYYSSISLLENQIEYAIRNWSDARGVDENKGQLIYCYVGPESDVEVLQQNVRKSFQLRLQQIGAQKAPLAVLFLNDTDGSFGQKITENWVLQDQMNDEESHKYANFILERKNTVIQEMFDQFDKLERERIIVCATDTDLHETRLSKILTKLFDDIYSQRIPFPFDGFNTSRGNAAKDCQLFMKELFRGNLDRDWISVLGSQQRNRAYEVLDKSWGVIGEDGLVRLKPGNKAVRKLIDFLDLYSGVLEDNQAPTPMNLGKLIRDLCMPPYGCNLASAGLLLATFVGGRKKQLNIMFDQQSISIDIWLQKAIPNNFLELSILDQTELIKISEASLSEWEMLLGDWEIATTLEEKINFSAKAKKLEKTNPVPQGGLYYKYELLVEKTTDAIQELNGYNTKVNSAIERIEKGIENENVSLMSWGTADLVRLHEKMEEENDKWTPKQIAELLPHIENGRKKTQEYFKQWLKHQRVSNRNQIEEFKHKMLEQVGKSLKTLGLEEERKALEKHVKEVDENIQFIAKVHNLVTDIEKMVRINRITNHTPISTLNHWLEQVKEFEQLVDEIKSKSEIVQDDHKTAIQKLMKFQQECKQQIGHYQERVAKVYNLESIDSLSDIAIWRSEIAALMQIYDGQEKDMMDFKLIHKQLELIEKHYRQLDTESLSEEEFESIYQKCLEESRAAFTEDSPPLDDQMIYEGIVRIIKSKRESLALDWIKHNVPDSKSIIGFSSAKAQEYRVRLQSVPRVLSSEQIKVVQEALRACENRLNDLEVDGLITRFLSLAKEAKRAFLKKLFEIIKVDEYLK